MTLENSCAVHNRADIEGSTALAVENVEHYDKCDARYVLSPGVVISPLDTSFASQMYQVVAEGHRYQISGTGYVLLQYLAEPRSKVSVDAFLSARGASRRPHELEQFFKFSVGANIVRVIDDTGNNNSVSGLPQRVSGRSPLLVHTSLFSQATLTPLTSRLSFLFNRSVVVWLGSIILVAHLLALFHDRLFKAVSPATIEALSVKQWLLLITLNVLAVFFHELGHSSACTRYSCPHGDIGLGLFLIYPVFFADVSAAWSLPRNQRVAVDAGGMYFHLIVSTICYAVWLVTHSFVALLLMYGIVLAVVFNLNPFFRFDGYWMLADLTGIPSLHRAAAEVVAWIWESRIKGRNMTSRPLLFTASFPIRLTVALYGLASTAVWGVFIYYLLWTFLPFVTHRVPLVTGRVALMLAHKEFGVALWESVAELAFLSINCWGFVLMLVRAILWSSSKLSLLAKRT
jgi:hypothetical protein